MITTEEAMFPNGVPALLTVSDMSRLLGISRPSVDFLVASRPDMVVELDGMKTKRVKSQLYFEIVGKKK